MAEWTSSVSVTREGISFMISLENEFKFDGMDFVNAFQRYFECFIIAIDC